LDDSTKDISDSIRIYISNTKEAKHYLLAPGIQSSTSETGSINLYGPLDLDHSADPTDPDGAKDGTPEQQAIYYGWDQGIYKFNSETSAYEFNREAKYYFDEPDPQTEKKQSIIYGKSGTVENFYYKNAFLTDFKDGKLGDHVGKCVGKTSATESDPLTLDIWIYMQGWAESVKDDNINAKFKIGLTFECQNSDYTD